MQKVLQNLKKQFPKEKSAILKPARNFKYENIIKVIDQTREITQEDIFLTSIDSKNKKHSSKILFDQIIFETQD